MTGRPRGVHPSRDELVLAALRCFLRDGYAATTVRAVAKEAGTSIAQLYLTFENKYAMYVAVHAHGNRLLREDYLVPAFVGEAGSPWERVMALIEAYMQFYLDHRELATLLALTSLDDEVESDPAVRAMYDEQRESIDALVDLVTQLTEEAGSDLDPGHVVRWCWAATSGLASINMRLPHLAIDDDELERVVRTGLRLTRAGINAAARPGS